MKFPDNIDTDLLYVSISPNAQSEEIDTYNKITNIVMLMEQLVIFLRRN